MSEQLSGRKRPLIFYGWIVVAISFVTLTIGYATRYSFSVFYVAILDEFGWLRAETALAFSVNMIVYAVLSPVAGTLIDRFGPRRVLPVGALICGLGVLGLSQLNSIWQLYFFCGLMAVGLVLMGYIVHSSFLPHWFSMKLGAALGIATVGMTVANVSVLPMQSLIENIGWRGAYIVLAITVVAVIVPLTALFQRRRAQDMGLQLDGISRTDGDLEVGITKPSQEDLENLRIVDKKWAATDWTLTRAIKTSKFWFFFLSTLALGIKSNIILVHTVAFFVDAGYSTMFAASIFALLGGLGLVSAVGGIISDRIGREWAYTLGGIGMGLGMLALFLIKDTSSPWLLYLFAVFYGAGVGIDRPITMAAKADVFRGKHLGIIMGVNNLSHGAGGAIGAWLAGYIFDVTGSYTTAFTISFLCLIGAVAFVWAAAPRKVRIVGGKVKRQQPAS
ncbi:MFS transporter [Chloroflexota bacterium]